jgi:pyruvate/2-oxoglutarate/acetoin dehydrogenase E1 component
LFRRCAKLRELTYLKALNEALEEEMKRDPSVIVFGEDVGLQGGVFGVTRGLQEKYGEWRVKDTPISESALVGTALGAALTGMRPVVEIMYIDFTMVAMDQIANQVAKIRYMTGGRAAAPLVIRTQEGATSGEAAQHSQSLEALFCHIPGLKVVMPSTPYIAKGLLKSAIRDEDPVIFIEHKMLYPMTGDVPEEDYTVPIGKAQILKEGSDVTIVATSWMVHKAMAAAETLSSAGIEAEVIDPITLVPLDIQAILDSVKKTGYLIVVHEAFRRCGFGTEVSSIVADQGFDYLNGPIKVIACKEAPIPYCPALEDQILPKSEDVVSAVMGLLGVHGELEKEAVKL